MALLLTIQLHYVSYTTLTFSPLPSGITLESQNLNLFKNVKYINPNKHHETTGHRLIFKQKHSPAEINGPAHEITCWKDQDVRDVLNLLNSVTLFLLFLISFCQIQFYYLYRIKCMQVYGLSDTEIRLNELTSLEA